MLRLIRFVAFAGLISALTLAGWWLVTTREESVLAAIYEIVFLSLIHI